MPRKPSSHRRGNDRGPHESRPEGAPQGEPLGQPDPRPEPSQHPPVHFRTRPAPPPSMLRETPVLTASWPGFFEPASDAGEHELQAHRTLEQVGNILRRMELDQAEIVRLRGEARDILQRLAA